LAYLLTMEMNHKWLGRVGQLNVAKSNGPKGLAPNKPSQ